MPKAVFKVAVTNLAKEGEDLQRIATRVPNDLRQSLKIQSAVMGVALNALYAVALREFMTLAIYGKSPFTWKKPSTSPRLDRNGAPRGSNDWVQILLILPSPLIGELQEICEKQGQSLASLSYTALDWYTQQQAARSAAFSTMQRAGRPG